MEDDAHSDALTAPSKGVNGTAAELECCGPVSYEKREPDSPYVVQDALIAERDAEFAAFAEAGTGRSAVG